MTSKLILGTAQFGFDYGINNSAGKRSTKEIFEMLNYAIKNGVKLLDTAEAYGTATEVIGSFHQNHGYQFKVISKFSNSSSVKDLVKESLSKLNVTSYDTFMFHKFDEVYNVNLLSDLQVLKSDGVIENIGVSVYSNDEFEKATTMDEIDLIQFPFNLLDNTHQRLSLIRKSKKYGKTLHVRSVFLQGLFFKQELPKKLKPLKSYLNRIKALSFKYNVSVSKMAMLYVLSFSEIDGIIVGIDSLDQLKENIDICSSVLSQDLLNELNEIRVNEIELINPVNW
jgi:aryl-alcohol dehydrogenase-like predicted oxidoreductase